MSRKPPKEPFEFETSAEVFEKGKHRPVCITVHRRWIELRAKGLRARHRLDPSAAYSLAVKREIA
jgi:hypothetical protein